MEMYEASLPCQARVAGEGVCLASATLAYANDFHSEPTTETDKPVNTNVNTATLGELKLLIGHDDLAKSIYFLRAWRIAPFTTTHQLANAIARYELIQTARTNERPGRAHWEERTAYYNDDALLMSEDCPHGVKPETRDEILARLAHAGVGFFYEKRDYPKRVA